jgi:polyisoprenoid-binding protein YceI
MSKKLLLVGGGFVVLAISAFLGVYVLFFTGDSPPPLKLSDEKIEAPVSALAGTWVPTGDGEAGYRVREKLAILPAESDAVGRTSVVTGSFALADDGDTLVATDISIEVDVSTLKSDEDRRDNRIRTDGLQTDTFPTATFVATGPIEVPASAQDGSVVKITATGDITIHGVTKTVDIAIDAEASGDTIELFGSYSFPMADFDINPPNVAGFVTVEDDATLEFRLVFAKQ